MRSMPAMNDRELVLTRLLDAPRELVFRAWTDPEHVSHWWGPTDFTVPSIRMDVWPGGSYRACLRSAEGAEYWVQGTFREIVVSEQLVFSWAWEDDDGKPDHETQVTVTFEDVGGKTLMTFRQAVFESVESRDSHEAGWDECLDRLAAWLPHAKAS